MDTPQALKNYGLSKYEIGAYLSLLDDYPVNGSQLSRNSGIPRASVYDALRSLEDKGLVVDAGDGLYEPLPPEELLNRLQFRFKADLAELKKTLEDHPKKNSYDHVWTLKGYGELIAKANSMIASAQIEIYLEIYPEEGRLIDHELRKAQERGVEIKFISMGKPYSSYELQVVHPDIEVIRAAQKGRVFDVIVDNSELLVGLLEDGQEETSVVNWAKNNWFVRTMREFVRHDFFHYFAHKLLDQKAEISEREMALYQRIKNDGWGQIPGLPDSRRPFRGLSKL